MTTIYHVTTKQKAEKIVTDGILFQPESAKWVSKRRELREKIDEKGSEKRDDWIPRKSAVFFWTTLEDAKTYQRVITSGEPVIVEVESRELELWCVDNHEVEFLFDNYMNNRIDDLETKIEDLIKYARKWNGDARKRLEVWTQPPVPSSEVITVLNRNGHELSEEL